MAIVFMDGFDHYTDLAKKWTSFGTQVGISAAQARTGTQSLLVKNTSDTNYFNAVKYLGASSQILVLGCGVNMVTYPAGAGYNFKFRDGAITHVNVRINASRFIEIYRGATLLGTSAVAVSPTGVWFFLEAKVFIDDSAGYVTVKINGADFYSLSGIDTRNAGNASCDTIELGRDGYQQLTYVDDLYVENNDFLGDIKIETLYPNGAGTTTSWDPSAGANYTCVDEHPDNADTDYVSTSVVDEIDTYAFTNLVTTAGAIKAIQTNLMARKDDAGYRGIAPVTRPSTVDRVGTTVALGTGYTYSRQIMETNPDNSQPWTIPDVNNAEFGVKLIG